MFSIESVPHKASLKYRKQRVSTLIRGKGGKGLVGGIVCPGRVTEDITASLNVGLTQSTVHLLSPISMILTPQLVDVIWFDRCFWKLMFAVERLWRMCSCFNLVWQQNNRDLFPIFKFRITTTDLRISELGFPNPFDRQLFFSTKSSMMRLSKQKNI